MIFISNPPACLENFIILKDGCYCDENGNKIPTPVPTSGFYIESLSGITVENLSDITNEANRSATNLVNQMVYFAAFIVEKRLLGLLGEAGLDLNKSGTLYDICSVFGNHTPPAALEKGIRLSRKNINSQQARIHVQSVKIKSKTAGVTTVKITDISGNVLWSQTVNLFDDSVYTVYVDTTFEPDVIYILADATAVQLYEWSCTGTGCCGNNVQGYGKEFAVVGWDGVQNSLIGYVGACAKLVCTDENLICQFAKRLAMAILYQTGAQILKEWVSPSSRINFIKLAGEQWAAEHIEIWEKMSTDLVQAEVKNIINILKTDGYCYDCKNRFQSIKMIP
jgi:hypothetical protein